MPDDERLGGTRDPHEYGRRHRREEPPGGGGEEKPRRRRRSMEAGGGLSVADLVQKHSASRADLTPVDPHQLQQNGLMSGRRARQDRQSAEGPAGRGHPGEAPRRQAPPPPSVADALNGTTPDFPRDDAPRPARRAARFPQDDNSRRPHPGEAARNGRRAAEAPGETSGPRRATGAFLPGPAAPVGETSGHHALPDTPATRTRRAGETSGRRALPPDTDRPRRAEASGHHAVPGEAPSPSPRPRRARRAGETSAHHALPGEPPAFPQDEVPNGRRNRRRAGEASAHHAVPGGPPAFPHEARNGFAPGEGTGHHAVPGEPPVRNGRRAGEASGHHAAPAFPH
ncbi:hypothetical protein ACIBVP_24665, partial [Actinophytocola sp. NPDC049390]